jgi:hypothetical protein
MVDRRECVRARVGLVRWGVNINISDACKSYTLVPSTQFRNWSAGLQVRRGLYGTNIDD